MTAGEAPRAHDLGGLPGEAVDRAEHARQPWEKRLHGLVRVLSDPARGVMTIDEMRRQVEDLGPGLYDGLGYYDRWAEALARLLIEKGVLTVDELGHAMAQAEARLAAARESGA